jgi:hypothetical protein
MNFGGDNFLFNIAPVLRLVFSHANNSIGETRTDSLIVCKQAGRWNWAGESASEHSWRRWQPPTGTIFRII